MGMRAFFATIVVLMSSAGVVFAGTPTIDVGQHELLPDTSGQTILISITGSDSLAGINLYAQVGDGGPELANFGLPAGIDGPAITAINLQPVGGIFAGTGTQTDLPGIPQVANSSFDVTAGTILANGILCELTIDTTGFTTGTWDLLLAGALPHSSLGGPYDTVGVAAGGGVQAFNIANGSLSVPEPATLSLIGLAGLAVVRRRRS